MPRCCCDCLAVGILVVGIVCSSAVPCCWWTVDPAAAAAADDADADDADDDDDDDDDDMMEEGVEEALLEEQKEGMGREEITHQGNGTRDIGYKWGKRCFMLLCKNQETSQHTYFSGHNSAQAQ